MSSITSANAVLVLTAVNLFPVPQKIEGWSSDSSFMHDDAALAETQMGVDGRLTAGFTPMEKVQNLKLQADSPSVQVFDLIKQTTEVTRDVVWLAGTLTIPATGEVFTFTRGVLQTAPVAKSSQKVLQPQNYRIVWESVKRSPI